MDRKRLESMTDDELMVAELLRIIRAERSKPDGDESAVQDCIDQIAGILNIPREEAETTVETKIAEQRKQTRRKKLTRIAAGAAAAVAVVVGISACSVHPVFVNWLKNIARMPAGAKVEEIGIQYTFHGSTVEYASIHELVKHESIEIYYPTNMTDPLIITGVERFEIDSYDCVLFRFKDRDTSVLVHIGSDECPNIKGDEIIRNLDDLVLYESFYKYDGVEFYAAEGSDGSNYYIIQSTSFSKLDEIINSLTNGEKHE